MSNTLTPSPVTPAGSPSNTAAPSLSSWAVPTAHDDEIWEGMTREQQLAALQDHFTSEDCTTPTANTVAEIVARARAGRPPS